MKRYFILFSITLLLMLPACGGGAGSGGGGQPSDYSGAWSAEEVIQSSTCSSSGDRYVYDITVTQNGSQITVATPDGPLSGVVNGTNASWTGEVYKSGTGYVTITFLDVQITVNSFSGTLNFEIRDQLGGPVVCSGSSTIEGFRSQVLPAAPGNLQATATSSTSISLTWADNSDNENGFEIHARSPFTPFFIYQNSVGRNVTSYTNSGLSPSATVIYEIVAFNAAGKSAPSNTANATTWPSSVPAPAAPSNLEAHPTNSSTVSLTWQDNSSDEEEFRIYRGTSLVSINALVASVSADSTSYTDNGLATNETYYYLIRAYNSGGGESSASNTANTSLSTPIGNWDFTISGTVTNCSNPNYPPGTRFTESGTTTVLEPAPGNLAILGGSISIQGSYNYNLTNYVIPLTGALQTSSIGLIGFNTFVLMAQLDWTGMDLNAGIFLFLNCAGQVTEATFTHLASQAPVGPTGLTATAMDTTTISLAWQDMSDNEEEFRIYRGTSSSTVNSLVATLGSGATGHNDSGLSPDTTYYYKVTAFNSAGESPPSNVADATTPAPPGDVPAKPTLLSVTPQTSGMIGLWWKYYNANDGFNIYRGTSATSINSKVGTMGEGFMDVLFSDSGLTPNTTYYYQITAFNNFGESPRSDPMSATTYVSGYEAPSDLTALAISETAIRLTWQDHSTVEDGFIIYEGDIIRVEADRVGQNVLTYTATGLTPGTTYTYSVRAHIGGRTWVSPYTNTASATTFVQTGGPPTTPANLQGTFASLSSVNLTWDDSTGEEEYWIEISSDGTNFTRLPVSIAGNILTDTITEMTPCTTTYFRVVAKNRFGESSPSNVWYGNTDAVAIIEISNPGGNPSLFPSFGSPYVVGCWDSQTNQGGIGIYDNDSNGLLDNESGNAAYIYPRKNVRDCPNCSTWHLEAGKRYDGSANLVLFFRFNTWSTAAHDNYLALYLNTNSSSPVSLWGGDLQPWGIFPGIAMFSQVSTPNVNGQYWLPTSTPGSFIGSASGYIAEVAADTGNTFDAGVTILDMNVPIFND